MITGRNHHVPASVVVGEAATGSRVTIDHPEENGTIGAS